MSDYRTLSASEARDLLRSSGRRVSRPHAMTKKVCHWSVCAHCGLVALKNDVSRRALRALCVTEE